VDNCYHRSSGRSPVFLPMVENTYAHWITFAVLYFLGDYAKSQSFNLRDRLSPRAPVDQNSRNLRDVRNPPPIDLAIDFNVQIHVVSRFP